MTQTVPGRANSNSVIHSSISYFVPTALLQAETVTAYRFGGNEATLLQKVYGKFAFPSTCEECEHEDFSVISADHPDHLVLFRENVSRAAAGRGRAVLEGVGLDAEVIEACFQGHPFNEEEAVQAGLIKWSAGQGRQPPTWNVLLEAMDYAKIARRRIHQLKVDLGLH